MDKCVSDAEFDSYWDYEAKNKNRNRIRVGRQYQASVPPLLKPGEKDGRKFEDLETLKWKPDQLSDQQLDQYFSMAKAVTSFAKALDNCRDPEKSRNETLHAAIKGLTEFVTSHHPCHRDAGCKVPPSSSSCPTNDSALPKSPPSNDWTAPEAQLFAQAIESCGKNFCAIKKEYLPWKPVCSLIEYYYYYGKGEKVTSPIHVPSVCKVEKTEEQKVEPIASCSHDCSQQVVVEHTKEKPIVLEDVKTETELLATPPQVDDDSKNKKVDESPASQMDAVDNAPQSTVGSLKFFLGGRLVLKLNAQQESGTKCQWVQSSEAVKHSHQMKKVKHRRKEMAPPDVTESPKHKKKIEENAMSSDGAFIPANKKAKLKPYSADTSPSSLCSMSWTPPVADGQDSVELEDASSSKTSEGCVSPVVMSSRNVKTEASDSKRKIVESSDQDRKPSWLSEGTFSEEYSSSSVLGFSLEKTSTNSLSEEACYELHNHKSALNRVKGILPRTAHSSAKQTRWPNPIAEGNSKAKTSPNFLTPNCKTCSNTSEHSGRDFVLDLSAKLDACETMDQEESMCCQQTSPVRCSSSEGSPHTPCSANECMSCCKSSNCSAYQADVAASQESKDLDNQDAQPLMDESDLASHSRVVVDMDKEGCYNPSTSCASPKCYKGYSSKEQLCNKEDGMMMSGNSSPNTVGSATDDGYSKKSSWYGNSMVQMYPHCYPYYVAYGVSPSTSSNSPTPEIPLDLSNSSSKKDERLLHENVPHVPADLPKNSADAMDRGMLYQLLRNKVTK